MRRPGLRLLATLVLCALCAPASLLNAQTAAPSGDAAVNVPAAPAPSATDITASAPAPADPAPSASRAFPGLDAGTSGFGQTPVWTPSDNPSARPGRPSAQNPFQLAPSMGSLSGSAGINTGFGGDPSRFGSADFGPASFTSARQRGAANPFGSVGRGGRLSSAGPLFLSTDERPASGGAFGQPDVTLPTLNEVLRGSYSLPVSSSTSSLKFSFQNIYKPGASFADPARPSASAMFSTSDLGNGVFFSAGTNYGSHSMAGAPAASIGTGTAAGPKHAGPSVALKLSF